jgi:hypothetical protein
MGSKVVILILKKALPARQAGLKPYSGTSSFLLLS